MFDKYKKNFFSQNGEDGVILELLKKLKLKKKILWCCEFGAWDGIHGSNTFNLVKKYNFKAVYIEGDKNRFKDLLKTKKKYSKIIAFNNFVDWKKKSINSLYKILKKTKIPKDFEILSIDIDSYDLNVWKSLIYYRPKIVIIEINSGIKPGIIQIHSKTNVGNSFTSTLNYAKKIGYVLVCHTGNCIFIKKKYINKIGIKKKYIDNPELLFDGAWLYKKENKLKRYIVKFLPSRMLDFLRKIKR
jgi:hypothetical protein